MRGLDADSCRVSSLLHLDVYRYFFFPPLMFVKVLPVPAGVSSAAALCRAGEGLVGEMQMKRSIWLPCCLELYIFLPVENF